LRCRERLAAEADILNSTEGLTELAYLISDLLNNGDTEIVLSQQEWICRVMNLELKTQHPHCMHLAEVERDEPGGLSFTAALLSLSVPVH